MGAWMVILEGNYKPWHILKGGLEDENDEMEEKNLFHDVRPIEHATWGRLEDRLVHTLELNGEGIKIVVADYFGKMHVEDYLD